jgi:hypothetical protein
MVTNKSNNFYTTKQSGALLGHGFIINKSWDRIRPIFPINPIFLKNPIICPIYRSFFLFYLYFVEKIGNAQKIDVPL